MSTGGKEGDLVLADVLRLPGQIGFDILEDDPGAANHGFLRSKGDMGSQQGINDVVLPQVYSYLVKRDLEGNIVGDVAESWEVSEDELTWTFHLRKGVKFHSGKELTAEDVKATYDRLLNKDDPVRYTQTMGFIDHCDIVDDYTINLVTLEPAGPMLASLKGKRFVTMAESNQYGKLDEETIKQLTGGEEIKARNLYETATTFLPQFTLWLSCNDLPTVSDKSLFASDRVRVIEFNRHFTEAEQDKNLKNEFQTQEAMQGIFAWLVAGYFKYKRFGLKMSPAMRKVVNQYERDNDLCLQFLEERCEQAEGVNIRSKSLFDAYKIWCKSNGYFACSAKRFNGDMETHPEWHGGKVVYQGYPVYKNLRLKGAS